MVAAVAEVVKVVEVIREGTVIKWTWMMQRFGLNMKSGSVTTMVTLLTCNRDQEWHVSHDQKEPASDADNAQPPKKRAKGNAAASKKEQQKPGRKPKVVSKHNTKQSQKVTKIKDKAVPEAYQDQGIQSFGQEEE